MIILNNPTAIERIADSTKVVYNPKSDVCLARIGARGDLLGGVRFTNYCVNSIQAHLAVYHPAFFTRTFLGVAFGYPFDKLGCRKIFAPIPSNNIPSRSLAEHIGFKLEVVVPEVFSNADLLVLAMKPEECRWRLPAGTELGDLVYG